MNEDPKRYNHSNWIVASVMKHRERMAMTERGMDPDVRKVKEGGLTFPCLDGGRDTT